MVIALKRKRQSKDQNLTDTPSPSRLKLTVSSGQEKGDECLIVEDKEDPLTVTDASSFSKKNNPLDFHKLMTETSSQEFFEALDSASAEDLDLLLRPVVLGAPRDSLTRRLGKSWQRVMAVPAEPRNFFSVVRWWESRRAFYNVVVGSIGMFMASLVCLRYQLSGFVLVWVLLICMVYAVVGNLCYTLGLPLELVARSIYKFNRYGPILFTLGLALSIFFVIVLGIRMVIGLPGLQG